MALLWCLEYEYTYYAAVEMISNYKTCERLTKSGNDLRHNDLFISALVFKMN